MLGSETLQSHSSWTSSRTQTVPLCWIIWKILLPVSCSQRRGTGKTPVLCGLILWRQLEGAIWPEEVLCSQLRLQSTSLLCTGTCGWAPAFQHPSVSQGWKPPAVVHGWVVGQYRQLLVHLQFNSHVHPGWCILELHLEIHGSSSLALSLVSVLHV